MANNIARLSELLMKSENQATEEERTELEASRAELVESGSNRLQDQQQIMAQREAEVTQRLARATALARAHPENQGTEGGSRRNQKPAAFETAPIERNY